MCEIRVQPSSGKQQAIIDSAGRIKIYLKSPPENGKANKELIDFLANTLSLLKGAITIISGLGARTKKISIAAPFDKNSFLKALGLTIQQTL